MEQKCNNILYRFSRIINLVAIICLMLFPSLSHAVNLANTEYVRIGVRTVKIKFVDHSHCVFTQEILMATPYGKKVMTNRCRYKIDGNKITFYNRHHSCENTPKKDIESYYTLCFYPANCVEYEGKPLLSYSLTDNHYPLEGNIVAETDGYWYKLPAQFDGVIETADSCLYDTYHHCLFFSSRKNGWNVGEQLSESQYYRFIRSSWEYLWYTREIPSDSIDYEQDIQNQTFVCLEDTIRFVDLHTCILFDNRTKQSKRTYYEIHGSYIDIFQHLNKYNNQKKTLLFRDGILYKAEVLQSEVEAPRSFVTNQLRNFQKPTGQMHVTTYINTSIKDVDTISIGLTFQKYYMPINYQSTYDTVH